jgi:membrane-associated protease RseP (regulator of RpoE activity)
LGYGDICISSTPRQKAKRSALSLAGYSLLLLALAFTAEHWSPAAFLAALFAPFGHEFLIKAGNKREFAGTPLCVPPAVGVKVMDLFADSAAGAAGMRPGDVIVNLNGCPVSDLHSFREQLRTAWLPLQLLVKRDGREKLIVIDSTLDLGIIPMPDRNMSRFMKIRQQLEIIRILKKKLQGLRRR